MGRLKEGASNVSTGREAALLKDSSKESFKAFLSPKVVSIPSVSSSCSSKRVEKKFDVNVERK